MPKSGQIDMDTTDSQNGWSWVRSKEQKLFTSASSCRLTNSLGVSFAKKQFFDCMKKSKLKIISRKQKNIRNACFDEHSIFACQYLNANKFSTRAGNQETSKKSLCWI